MAIDPINKFVKDRIKIFDTEGKYKHLSINVPNHNDNGQPLSSSHYGWSIDTNLITEDWLVTTISAIIREYINGLENDRSTDS